MCLGKWKEGVHRGDILAQLFYFPVILSLLPTPIYSLVTSSLPTSARYLLPNSPCAMSFSTYEYVKLVNLAFPSGFLYLSVI